MLKEKQKGGITLISLVITIILLLILASVAISIAIDSNGIFGRARYAADTWNKSVTDEKTTTDDAIKLLNEINIGTTNSDPTKGSIKIICKGEDDDVLTGATFEIYSYTGTIRIIKEVSIDSEFAVVDNLEFGTYYLKCTKIPDGYGTMSSNDPNSGMYYFTIVDNSVKEVIINFSKGFYLPSSGSDTENGMGFIINMLNPDEPVSISLQLHDLEGSQVVSREVKLYRIAKLNDDNSFTYMPEYEDCGKQIPSDFNSKNMEELAEDLRVYSLINCIDCFASCYTDASEKAVFDNLEPGLYLIIGGNGFAEFPPILLGFTKNTSEDKENDVSLNIPVWVERESLVPPPPPPPVTTYPFTPTDNMVP